MKKLFFALLSVAVFSILAVTPVVPQLVSAQAETDTETTDEKIEKTLDNRIQQYKKDHPNTLSAAQLAKLKGLCKPAQVKTGKFTRTAVDKGDQRLKLYESAVTKLEDITKKVETYNSSADKTKTINLDELKAQTAELKTKVAKFKVDLSTYQVALNDLSTINCQQFTDTFKSALDEVRETQKTLVTTSNEIQALITDKIKPELAELKTTFNSTKTTDTDKTKANDSTDGNSTGGTQ